MHTIHNVADFVDLSDAEGRTYRQVNASTQHKFNVGDLVELAENDYDHDGGLRLFVGKQTRDCDQSPLYSLTLDLKTIGRARAVEDRGIHAFGPFVNTLEAVLISEIRGRFMHSVGEDSLTLVKSVTENMKSVIEEAEKEEKNANYRI